MDRVQFLDVLGGCAHQRWTLQGGALLRNRRGCCPAVAVARAMGYRVRGTIDVDTANASLKLKDKLLDNIIEGADGRPVDIEGDRYRSARKMRKDMLAVLGLTEKA